VRKPRQAGIADKQDMAVAQADQIASRILAAPDIIRKDHVVILQILPPPPPRYCPEQRK
jgi:hypothetical protein